MSEVAPNPRYTRHVDAMYPQLEDLFAAADAVDSLSQHPGVGIVAGILGREMEHIDLTLDGTEVPLHQSEYAFAHGRRGGLRAFQQAAVALVARADKRRTEQAQKHESGAETSLGG